MWGKYESKYIGVCWKNSDFKAYDGNKAYEIAYAI
jgi:hypothetical protein